MKNELGILCHISSLPGKYGIGDFGQSSRNFVDFLKINKFNIWQILPLNKTNEYNCPYSSICYYSFDEMFVDPEYFLNKKLIKKDDLKELKQLSKSTIVKYDIVKKEKLKIIDIAFSNLSDNERLEVIKKTKKIDWIQNYAYYTTVLSKYKTGDFRDINVRLWNKNSKEYREFLKENEQDILKQVYIQYILNIQWSEIKKYANQNGIKILGDLPIYPNPNSFDVFESPQQFKLDKNLKPLVSGGVPGDEFCPDGQNWGTCVYNWPLMKKEGFAYLLKKIKLFLSRFDILRLDHVMGYDYHYEWAPNNKGKWQDGGGYEFFNILSKNINMKKIVIEDLGIIHQSLNEIKNIFKIKGMKVVQFALDDESILESLVNNITYLGTHDNNTFLGYLKTLNSSQLEKLCNMFKIQKKGLKQIQLGVINKLVNIPNLTIILQIQDYLLQDESSRMNYPGRAADCWEYRVPNNYKKVIQQNLKEIKK